MTAAPQRTGGQQTAAWAASITLAIVTIVIAAGYTRGDWRLWPALLLAVLLIVVQRLEPELRYGETGSFVQITAMLAISVALAALGANITAVIIIGMVLSAHVVHALPGRKGFIWIGVFILLTFAYLIPLYDDPVAGLFSVLGMSMGYLFFGSAAYAQKRAEAADAESRRLLEQLERANEQLRDHASRAEALAVAQERNRVAREVHDTLGHRLTVAAVQLEGAQKLIARDPDKAARMVDTVREQVMEGLAELRSTVAMLRTPLENVLTLPNALSRLAAEFQTATGIAVHVALPGDLPPVDDEQRHALLRAAQEALTNVQRHAGARNVWIALRRTAGGQGNGDLIELCVQDDGRGYRTPAAPAENTRAAGYGLHGLRERAEQMRGRLILGGRPGGGASLCFAIPLRPAPELPAEAAALEGAPFGDGSRLR